MKRRRGVIGDPLFLHVLEQFDFGNFLKMAAIVVAILVVAGVAGYAMYRYVEIVLPTFPCRPLKPSRWALKYACLIIDVRGKNLY
jgi:hypothetical protein